MNTETGGVVALAPGTGMPIPGAGTGPGSELIVKALESDTRGAYSLLEWRSERGGTWVPAHIHEATPATSIGETEVTLREFRDGAERNFILRVLKKHRGNITQAALELRVGRPYLHKRLAVLGIEKRDWFL